MLGIRVVIMCVLLLLLLRPCDGLAYCYMFSKGSAAVIMLFDFSLFRL